jgi:CubicO group peptidase (beta-lactamase class C family)
MTSWQEVDRLDEAMAGYVDRGEVAGLITHVSRPGDVRVNVLGSLAFGGEPLQRDSLFRVASWTKPIVAAAAMILVDEGRLELDDPIDHLLPELASRRVLARDDGPIDETVPANRPITLRDLLTFRMGLGEPIAAPGSLPLQAAEAALGVRTFGPPVPRTQLGPDEWIRKLGTLPLQYQPGERWRYSTGSHVLGVLLARATDQPLEVFLRERLFEPLGMKDTGFAVPANQLARLTTSYIGGEEGLEVYDDAADSQWSQPPSFPDAGGGLVSTADDFAAFAQMMVAGGAGLMSPQSVEQMTTDQLTSEQRADAAAFLGQEAGWGFGLAVLPDRYGWAGGLGTLWYTLPEQQTVALLLTQRTIWTPAPEMLETFDSALT